ncbi:DoxX-like family protein [Solirubrum puertoriconensis]|uniref:DoxX family protein n=1 Tax=Solirubrum puertoriconensis TaxID=1751427 RepID=A0A9X0L4C3_SOLP1|nr:DoxX-like family protein [Solirubrum puertoriconensis]KUG07267.1 hypothetical protein ASU33_12940 [Solirubrum puertoriconensis]
MSTAAIRQVHTALTWGLAAVWLINGLVCKVLLLVPRHQQIVGRILDDEYAAPLTRAIGVAEVGMALWVLSGIKLRWCVALQMILVTSMNVLEYGLALDLLLWHQLNALFAGLFVLLLWYYGFVLTPARQQLAQ